MNGYQMYRKHQQPGGTTRIDLLLAMFDGAVSRMQQAEALLEAGDERAAVPLLARAQLIVSALAAGVRTDIDEANGTNLLRLYEFVVSQLALKDPQQTRKSREILETVREGFQAIREQAIDLERRGEVVASDNLRTVIASA